MGVRPYKKLGWGLTGLEHDERGQLTDPRVNGDALYHRTEDFVPRYLEYLRALRDAESPESDEWFELMMTVSMVEADFERSGPADWPVTRESEAGRRDLLLIQPVGFREWSRYGDRIDHAEEEMLHPGIEPRVVPMPYGIYPFEGIYMDDRTGRKLDGTAKRLFERLLRHETDDPNKEAIRQKTAAHLAGTMGFDSPEQAQQHIAPVVPSDVMHVISWLNLFNGPEVHLQLRPMLYVYWN